MELCSSALSSRYRTERVPVEEVLRIAVKIGSAVETAHRAGVLHRDIKPSNILMTAYGHPVLSDFGIASTLAESDTQEAVGMSIPWTAPEVLMDETAGSIPSEVWAFAATIYSLLAGRSPFEVAGGANASTDLISRINRAKPQPIDRADVPASLENVLRRAMSRKPADRPATVLELVREFQGIEIELGLPQTGIEVAMDDWALATVADLEDRTRIRGLVSATPDTGRRRRRGRTADQPGSVMVGARPARTGSGEPETAAAARPKRMTLLGWGIVGTAVLVIAFGATAAALLVRDSGQIPRVTDISAVQQDGMVAFSWQDPGLRSGDSYNVTTGDGKSSAQKASTFSLPASAGEQICIRVRVNRDGDLGDFSNEKCVDA
jgi:hypothetical protein